LPATPGQQTGKHGPQLDEQLKHETEGLVRSSRPTRVEEFRDPEPAGRDQPTADRGILPEDRRGTPPGMTQADIDERPDVAQALGTSAFPGDRHMQDVAKALGLAVETRRT